MKVSSEARERAGMYVGAGMSLTTAAGLLVVAGAGSATAAAACPAGSSEVAPGVCSVTQTSSGSFTVPAGVTTLEAILIGGGGAGDDISCSSYTGGESGEVTYVTGISTAGPVSVVVGAGGPAPVFGCEASSANDGGTTSITDAASTFSEALGGGYANGSGDPGGLASAGVALLAGTVALWPAYGGEPCFADDGQDGVAVAGDPSHPDFFGGTTSTLPCGGGAAGDTEPGDSDEGGDVYSSAVAGTGSGGAAWSYFWDDDIDLEYVSEAGDGASGAVVFRFYKSEVLEAVIADTGPANEGLGWASAVLVAAGAALLAGARRVRRITV